MKKVASHDGTTIAYDERGDGHGLILVGGALNTRASGSKAELVALLARHLTVYSYDRRGRGDSGDMPPYAVEREIEDIEALIDHAGGAAYLYGHSSGGCLAPEVSATRSRSSRFTRRRTTTIPRPRRHGASTSADSPRRWRPTTAVMQWRCSCSTWGCLLSRSLVRQTPFWPNLEAIAPTLAYDHTEIMGTTGAVPTEKLSAVAVRAPVMCGGSSPPFMQATARTISQAVPNAVFSALDGQSHDVQPAALAPVLIEFLRA